MRVGVVGMLVENENKGVDTQVTQRAWGRGQQGHKR
jgi:hypothetical protein